MREDALGRRLVAAWLGRWTARRTLFVGVTVIAVLLAACSGYNTGGGGSGLSGTVEVAGSSTVFPIAEAWAEEFGLEEPRVRVNVASIGSGAGFERFCNGETDISNASRAMTVEEAATCAGNGVDFIEIPVAFDGLTVAVHPDNDWVDFLTVDELGKLFGVTAFAETWDEVRAGWPDEKVVLFSPGSDSGTFDYFTDVINGEEGVQRTQNTQFSEDDNVLVQGVGGVRSAVGYFGFAFFVNNQERVRAIPIDGGGGAIAPSRATIESGVYAPLSRPLFIYVRISSLQEPEVRAFVDWVLTTGRLLVDDPTVGYVRLPKALYTASLGRVSRGVATGALMETAPAGATLVDLFGDETP